MEEWKVYPEVSNYEVSSLGRVRNIKTGRVLAIVDHINQDRQDNRVENLRWTTHKGNSRNTKFNSKVKICDFEGNVIKEFYTIIEAAEYYDIPNDKMCAAAVVNSKIQGYITYT